MNAIVSKLLKKYDPTHELEKCGLVIGNKLVESSNCHSEPTKGFVIPAEFMLKYEDTATGTWHTHPNDKANLSHEDYAGFSQWPDLFHYIIGIDGVRCFKLQDDLIVEVPLD